MNKFFEFRNETTESADLLLYGSVGDSYWWDDITPDLINEQINKLGSIKDLNIRINSYGGSVFAGQAIYTALKRCTFNKNVYIDGIAASIASVIMCAGDTVYMPKNALIMIHNPISAAYGEAKDFEKEAETLDKVKQTIINVYKDKTGLGEDKISEMMDEETWLTANEAKELGFIDVIEDEEVTIESIHDSLVFNNLDFKFTRKQLQCIQNKIQFKDSYKNSLKEKKEEEILNLDEFKIKYPDLLKQIRDEITKEERERIKAIDALSKYGNDEGFKNILNNAKFESYKTADQIALEVLKYQNEQRVDIYNNRREDTAGLSAITQPPIDSFEDKKKINNKEEEDFVKLVADSINQKRGVK